MDKRAFLKASGALLTSGMWRNSASGAPAETARTNWAGNYKYQAGRLHEAKTAEDVQRIVKSCDKLKALGSRHSFNSIADSKANQISLKSLTNMALDRKARTVTAGAGVTYGALAPYLYENGYAVHNLASLPHVSIVGACATATHGSGDRNGNLSTAVTAFEMVTASGERVTMSRERDGDRFRGAVVNLGGLGVVTQITLNVVPAFAVRQAVYRNLPFDQLKDHFDVVFSSGYSVSLFTDWQNHQATQVWIKRDSKPGESSSFDAEFFGAKLAKERLHPLEGHSAENCTEQLGIPGPWHERLPHFRMNFTPSSGAELQSEFFVPREKAFEAILAVERLRDRITPHLFISELRSIAADDLWMSPAYKRASIAIHFTWKPEWEAVRKILPVIERQLAPFEARPHWAKLFSMTSSRLRPLYPKMADFQALLKEYDANGKFRNEFLDRNLSRG